MARGLIQAGIPAVIAMHFSISDEGGIKFAESFYTKIVRGRSLEFAAHAARRTLLLSDNYHLQCDALALVLLTSNGECLKTTQVVNRTTQESPTIDFSFYLPLPQLGHGFFGRRKEYRQIRDGILQQNQRATIIHGIGGIGKTAFVSHVATRLKRHFQGVYAFDCSSGTLTPRTVMLELHRFLAAQGVNALEQLLYQYLQPELMATSLAQVLSQWSVLLIFDNFESQLESTNEGFRIADKNLRTFVTLLVKTTAERSHFLFTSRYLFDLDDKRLGNIQSLPLQDLSRPEGLSLMHRLQHLAPAGYLDKVKALEAFGGHPFALVTLDRYCSNHALSNALESSTVIHGGLREFLAIELNYTQLSERSRDLLNRLAAFKQAVPYSAAEWVIGEKAPYEKEFLERLFVKARDGWPKEWEGHFVEADMRRNIEQALPDRRIAEDLINPIGELIRWGLLTPIQGDGELKELSVHTLVREFCRDKHQREVWRELLRDAAAFYTNLIKVASEEKTNTQIWTEVSAFELLMEADDFNEAAVLLFDAHRLLQRWGFGNYLENQYSRLANKLDANGTASLLHHSGSLALLRGEHHKAIEFFERALKASKDIGNRTLMAGPLAQIADIHYNRREYGKAMKYYEQALEISEECRDYSHVASTLHQIGMIYEEQREFERASEYYERSMKIAGSRSDRANFAVSLRQIGVLVDKSGYDGEKAVDSFRKALEIFDELNDRANVAKTLAMIGNVYLRASQHEKAAEFYSRSLRIREELGSRLEIAALFQQIATIHDQQGTPEQALEYAQRSLRIRDELGDRAGIATSLHRIAMIQEHLGSLEKALDYYSRSVKMAEKIGDPFAISTPLMQLGLIYHRQDNFDKAWDCYQRSIKITKEGDLPAGLAHGLNLRGMLFISLGRFREAFGDLFSSWKMFTDLESRNDAEGAARVLKLLRSVWRERDFDAEWKKVTSEGVPVWLKQ
jgi:tetratricopeptide (TPR) repeat protein